MVVVGVIVEYKAPLWEFLQTLDIAVLAPAIGGILIAVGVGLEILMGILASRREHQLRDINAEEVARLSALAELERKAGIELEAEVERLRKENNDRELLDRYRSVGNVEVFEEAMRAFSGTKYALEFWHSQQEVCELQWRLNISLTNAGWIRGRVMHRQNLSFGVWVMTVVRENHAVRSKAAEALAGWLDDNGVATIIAEVKTDDDAGTVVIQIGPRPETMQQYKQIRAEYRRLRE